MGWRHLNKPRPQTGILGLEENDVHFTITRMNTSMSLAIKHASLIGNFNDARSKSAGEPYDTPISIMDQTEWSSKGGVVFCQAYTSRQPLKEAYCIQHVALVGEEIILARITRCIVS